MILNSLTAFQVIDIGGELGNPEVLSKNVELESNDSTNTLSDSEKAESLNIITDDATISESAADNSKAITSDSEEFIEFVDVSETEIKNTSDTSLSQNANITLANTTSINFTKVNCLEDKLFGPVEVTKKKPIYYFFLDV